MSCYKICKELLLPEIKYQVSQLNLTLDIVPMVIA